MGSFIIIFYIIIFVVICWCCARIVVPCVCAVCRCRRHRHRHCHCCYDEKEKGHPTTNVAIPITNRVIFSITFRVEVEAQLTILAHGPSPSLFQYTTYILSIIYSFYFFCLFDYVSKFFNSERFSLIYLPYSMLTEPGTQNNGNCFTVCAHKTKRYRQDCYR